MGSVTGGLFGSRRRLYDGAHLAELVAEHLARLIVRGIDAVARGLGGRDKGHETDVWDVAHPMHGAWYSSVRGHRQCEHEDDARDRRAEQSLHRGSAFPMVTR